MNGEKTETPSNKQPPNPQATASRQSLEIKWYESEFFQIWLKLARQRGSR
jgi:hypothetical protein